VIEILHGWRLARDMGKPIIPSLTIVLHRDVDTMLVPSFASLMALGGVDMERRISSRSEDRPKILGRITRSRFDGKWTDTRNMLASF
jgi:hypothetical protein